MQIGVCLLLQILGGLENELLEETLKKYNSVDTLWDLQQYLGVSLEGLLEVIEGHLFEVALKGLSGAEILKLLNIKSFECIFKKDPLIQKVVSSNSHFFVYKRVKHVIDETLRVKQFNNLLRQSEMSLESKERQLGELMNQSQRSCSQLYECSSENLDELTNQSLKCGAVGSRLTGAGWGGCFISLVPRLKVGWVY